MLLSAVLTLLALQVLTPDTTSAPAPADAYLDRGARELVTRARARRQSMDRSITQYRTLARERVSLGIRALRRDRQMYLRETAFDILWRRDAPGEVEVLGAREALPMFVSGVRVAGGLRSYDAYHAFDPADPDLVRAVFSDTDNSIRHPLAEGSEANYRFRSGDTTAVRLPDGRTLRLIELQVTPRRREFHLASGSLWLDADTHALVRAVVRPARPWDIDLDGDEDADDVPGFVKPIRGEIDYIAIEYGLWEMRWWLPRLIAFEGSAEAGGLGVRALVRYERTYTDYQVTAAAAAPGDTVPVLTRCPEHDEDDPDALACRCQNGRCQQFSVRLPADTTSLLTSPYLPPTIFADGSALITAAEMRQIREQLERMQPPVWGVTRPTFRWALARQDLLRYNRVEGLSLGARAAVDLGAFETDAVLRLGVADLEPEVGVGLTRQSVSRSTRAAAYHRLAVVDPSQRPLGFGNSLSALFLGRDEGDYFRASGLELLGTPPESRSQLYRWRLFAERQRGVEKETDFSLPHLLDDARGFRPNLAALRADQIGASLQLRYGRGLDPAGVRWGAELLAEGATGTFRFARPSLTLSLNAPLPGRFMGALEVAGGTSLGEVPRQSAWYLGGSGSVRGYAPLSAGGTAFWRARTEVSNVLPGARWVLFSDAGWAGPRDRLELDPLLLSAGAGASFLDGLIRFDVARALRGEERWRAELYLNGTL